MGRGLIILLFVSLAINVLIGGFMGGVFVERAVRGAPEEFAPPPDAPMPPRGGGFERSLEVLTPESRRLVRRAFLENRTVIRERRRAVQEAREDMVFAFAEEEWDRERLEQAMSAVAAAEAAMKQAQFDIMLTALEALPPAERRAVIEAQAQRRLQRPSPRNRLQRSNNP